MSSSESEHPAAGWYVDPRGGHRWWDGEVWTQHRQSDDGVVWTDSASADVSTGAGRAATSPSPLGTILGLVGSLTLLFSTFSRWMTISDGKSYNAFDRGLPWVLTGADYDPVFDSGFFAHGMLYLLLSLVAIFFVIRASQRRRDSDGANVALVGVLILLFTAVNAFTFRSAFATLNEAGSTTVGVGIGLWLALLASMAIVASGLLLAERR